MAVRPRGKKWQADVKDLDGQRIRLTFDDLKEAEKWEEQALRFVGEGKPVPTKDEMDGPVTLKAFYLDHRADIWDEVTTTVTRVGTSCLKYFGDDIRLKDITTPVVNRTISQMNKDGLSASTINSRLSWISKLLKYAKAMEEIDHLPSIKRRKIGSSNPRFLMPDDELKIKNWFMHHGLEDEWLYLQFLLYTGARFSEPLYLTRMDITEDTVTFPVTKAGIRRTVPLTKKSRESLTHFLNKRSNDKIFEGIVYWTVIGHWGRLRQHLDRENDKTFTIHILRHTCASSRLLKKSIGERRSWLHHHLGSRLRR